MIDYSNDYILTSLHSNTDPTTFAISIYTGVVSFAARAEPTQGFTILRFDNYISTTCLPNPCTHQIIFTPYKIWVTY